MVAHLGVVHHLGGVGGVFPGEAQHSRRHSTQIRNLFRHVRGQIAAVRPGIGRQLFLIKELNIVKGLLGGVVEQTVGLPLEGGQVIELRGVFGLFLSLHRPHNGAPAVTGYTQLIRVRLLGKPITDCPEVPAVQFHRVELRPFETGNRFLPLHQNRQRGGQHPAHIQRPAPIKRSKKPGGIDAHQPIRLRAAQRRRIEVVIAGAVRKGVKAPADRGFLH